MLMGEKNQSRVEVSETHLSPLWQRWAVGARDGEI